MEYRFLDKINSYQDYKNFDDINEKYLAKEIRHFLIDHISKTGGHLASNLGIVETTLALSKVFDLDRDKVIYDVGHQAYVHKIITGRKEGFKNLRQFEGMSGFPKTEESNYDHFNTGHSSTSISASVGMAIARDVKKEDYRVIAVIGDASFSNGLAFEGLNYLANSKLDVLVILNDNEMSISKNVGAITKHLSDIRLTQKYRNLSTNVKESLSSIPYIGDTATHTVKDIKDMFKNIVVPGEAFRKIGLNYFGPIDGHNYEQLRDALTSLKSVKGPKILHIKTIKGKGYRYSQQDPSSYHGVGKFDPKKPLPKSGESFSSITGDTIKDIISKDSNTIVISPAMLSGTGIENVREIYPKNIVDVGIEESNAVTIAAGSAMNGIKTYVATYSTFFQRAYDQILHDVALQNLSVTFLIDRAGVVGEDGETHNGIYDLSYLSHIPNMTIFAPKDGAELVKMIHHTHSYKTPVAIRYPKSKNYTLDDADISFEDIKKWEIYGDLKNDYNILATGKMVKIALDVKKALEEKNIVINVINARCIKPLDTETLNSIMNSKIIFSMEDNVYIGGFSSYVLSYLTQNDFRGKFKYFAFEDVLIEHGSVDKIFEKYHMDAKSITNSIYDTITKNN